MCDDKILFYATLYIELQVGTFLHPLIIVLIMIYGNLQQLLFMFPKKKELEKKRQNANMSHYERIKNEWQY